jgi:hypothetical protein
MPNQIVNYHVFQYRLSGRFFNSSGCWGSPCAGLVNVGKQTWREPPGIALRHVEFVARDKGVRSIIVTLPETGN